MGDEDNVKARWRRRGSARPGEIVDAALVEFARHGFAAARMADIAARAGLSKAALYVYFPTKADLFRAIISQRLTPQLDAMRHATGAPSSFDAELTVILGTLGHVASQAELRRLARMVITESGNFPELAVLWRENVVSPALQVIVSAIRQAQARGEVRAGDPDLLAFTIAGPLIMGLLWREIIEPLGATTLDLEALAAEHLTVLRSGLLISDVAIKEGS